VSLREIGELLAQVCRDARAERQRELAEAVATAEREISALIDLEPVTDPRPSLAEGNASSVSGISQRPHSQRSFSPTPTPYLLPSLPAANETGKSSSISRQLRPKRRGVWLALGLAASFAAAAWLPTVVRGRSTVVSAAVAPVPITQAPPVPTGASQHAAPADEAARPAESAAPAPASASAVAKPARARIRTAPAPVKTGVIVPSARARGNCDPPYFFSAGIKTSKPECI
jgi:hypothetical protein